MFILDVFRLACIKEQYLIALNLVIGPETMKQPVIEEELSDEAGKLTSPAQKSAYPNPEVAHLDKLRSRSKKGRQVRQAAIGGSSSSTSQQAQRRRSFGSLSPLSTSEEDSNTGYQLTEEQQAAYDNALANYLSRGDSYEQEEEAQQQLTEEQQNSLDNAIADYFDRP